MIRTILSLMLATLLFGCSKNEELQTEVIQTKTIKCGMCEKNIEKALYAVEGVKSVDVDLKEKNVRVQFLPVSTNLQTLEMAISDAGYDANERPRDLAGYEKLPACCK